MYKPIVVSILFSGALATRNYPALFPRQTYELSCSASGEKDCGTGCIPLTYTCCPGAQGGCPATEVCWLGDNGIYGCCPLGETCEGPGGVNSQPGEIITSTQTFTSDQTFTTPIVSESTTTSVEISTPPTTFTSQAPTSSSPAESSAPPSETTTSTSETLPTGTSSATTPTITGQVVVAGAVENFRAGPLPQLLGAMMAAIAIL